MYICFLSIPMSQALTIYVDENTSPGAFPILLLGSFFAPFKVQFKCHLLVESSQTPHSKSCRLPQPWHSLPQCYVSLTGSDHARLFSVFTNFLVNDQAPSLEYKLYEHSHHACLDFLTASQMLSLALGI